IELDAQTKEIAVKSAKATGAEICGVDILNSIRGPLVLETNISPGLQGITKATKINVADSIAKYLHKQALLRKEKIQEKETKNVMNNVNNEGELISNLDYRGTRI